VNDREPERDVESMHWTCTYANCVRNIDVPERRKLIETIRGIGYVMRVEELS
jgi:hypothetical protein